MTTLLDQAARTALHARLTAVHPDTPARWGRMRAADMLAHCTDWMRMATSELPVELVGPAIVRAPLVRPVVQWLVLEVVTLPRSSPTAPELVARPAGSVDAERTALLDAIARFARLAPEARGPAHPLLGEMTVSAWGRLGWKHLDHHLRQFGV